MSKLKISDKLSLPVDAVTQTIGILAKRRVGKSYTARRFTEQLVKAKQQVAIVDPKGDWWGIRNASDGKSPGLPIVILGGERADVPLEVGSGEMVAKLVAEERVSVLLDLSLFRKHEVATFMTAFLENLYRLKAREQYRTPLMLMLDEADAVAPQKPQKGEERMLGAAEDIVRRGGQRGIGCTMITQRTAVLNKNVLTQCQMLIALRTIAPQDLAAMNAWVDVHGTEEQRHTLMGSLPSLPVGEAWFWSPGWPTTNGIFQRVSVLPIETFDSGATPKPGEKRVDPKNAADVDLDALRKTMAATIERAKADDPKLLRAEIARLKADQAKRPLEKSNTEIKTVDRFVLKDGQLKRLEEILERARNVEKQVRDAASMLENQILAVSKAVAPIADAIRQTTSPIKQNARSVVSRPPAPRQSMTSNQPASGATGAAGGAAVDGEFKITPKQQQILDAIAWFESIGNIQPTTLQVGAIALIDATGGHFSNTVGPLSSYGLINRGSGCISLTDKGREFARVPDQVSTLADYHDVLRQRVRRAKSAGGKTVEILNAIIAAGGNELRAEEIGRQVGIDHTGGHFSNTIGPLGTLGFIERSHGVIRPTDIIFPPGLE